MNKISHSIAFPLEGVSENVNIVKRDHQNFKVLIIRSLKGIQSLNKQLKARANWEKYSIDLNSTTYTLKILESP